MNDLPGFLVAGLALTGSPGPATLGLAAAGAAFGFRRSLALFVGLVVGVVAVMLLTASGLAGLVLAQPGLGPAVKALAAAYMLWLAWRIATAPPLREAGEPGRPPSFLGGVLLGVGNPKAYAAMAALFSGFALLTGRPAADAALKMAILVGVILVVDVAWLLLGAALTRAFRDPRTNRVINIAFAVLLLASVGLALAL